ncbi:hypothetical protein EPI10_028155 [Gossypium australe]|uniref:Uncharacterized protein n=1 Tax=Gossypium australe TaxID=47621 RepID=A0A5B6UXU4_9ROSI|nr:hypothetical protein EPI10_028155 [Gossypium australe]
MATESLKCKRFLSRVRGLLTLRVFLRQQPRRFGILEDFGELHRHGLKGQVRGSGLRTCRRPLTSSSLASLGGSVRTPAFLVCNFVARDIPGSVIGELEPISSVG